MSPTPSNLQAMYEGKAEPDDVVGPAPKRPMFRRLGPDWAFYLVIAIVVAALAMIKVPGCLEAQTRSKLSMAAQNLRSIVTALEAYAADHGVFPRNGLGALTTPVAYLERMPSDPFSDEHGGAFRYHTNGRSFIVGSGGPDRHKETDGDLPWHDPEAMDILLKAALTNPQSTLWQMAQVGPGKGAFSYDASNGTLSEGDIWRVGGKAGQNGNAP